MAQNMFQAKLEGQPDLASAGSSAVPVSALPVRPRPPRAPSRGPDHCRSTRTRALGRFHLGGW